MNAVRMAEKSPAWDCLSIQSAEEENAAHKNQENIQVLVPILHTGFVLRCGLLDVTLPDLRVRINTRLDRRKIRDCFYFCTQLVSPQTKYYKNDFLMADLAEKMGYWAAGAEYYRNRHVVQSHPQKIRGEKHPEEAAVVPDHRR